MLAVWWVYYSLSWYAGTEYTAGAVAYVLRELGYEVTQNGVEVQIGDSWEWEVPDGMLVDLTLFLAVLVWRVKSPLKSAGKALGIYAMLLAYVIMHHVFIFLMDEYWVPAYYLIDVPYYSVWTLTLMFAFKFWWKRNSVLDETENEIEEPPPPPKKRGLVKSIMTGVCVYIVALFVATLYWSSSFTVAETGSVPLMRLIVYTHGEEVLDEKIEDWTHLHCAVSYGRTKMAEYLISKYADVNATCMLSNGIKGVTPLHMAAYGGHDKMIALLLAHGADVNAKESVGDTPLHIAAEHGHTECVKVLLAHGARTDVVCLYMAIGVHNWTPLHNAAEGGHREIVELLLAAGADPQAVLSNGKTPGDVAEDEGFGELAEFLRAAAGRED